MCAAVCDKKARSKKKFILLQFYFGLRTVLRSCYLLQSLRIYENAVLPKLLSVPVNEVVLLVGACLVVVRVDAGVRLDDDLAVVVVVMVVNLVVTGTAMPVDVVVEWVLVGVIMVAVWLIVAVVAGLVLAGVRALVDLVLVLRL